MEENLVVRVKELPQGIIDTMQDGDFMMAVGNLEFHADSTDDIDTIAERIAEARERHGLTVDEMGVAVSIARAALMEQAPEA